METNRQRLERLGMIGDISIEDIPEAKLCGICDELIEKNLSPQNPVCEGRWCGEAVDLWLNEEADEDE